MLNTPVYTAVKLFFSCLRRPETFFLQVTGAGDRMQVEKRYKIQTNFYRFPEPRGFWTSKNFLLRFFMLFSSRVFAAYKNRR